MGHRIIRFLCFVSSFDGCDGGEFGQGDDSGGGYAPDAIGLEDAGLYVGQVDGEAYGSGGEKEDEPPAAGEGEGCDGGVAEDAEGGYGNCGDCGERLWFWDSRTPADWPGRSFRRFGEGAVVD